jgi:hypothetical protein
MGMTAQMKTLRVWFCLIPYLLVLGSIQKAVFCIGADGHAHINVDGSCNNSCSRSAHAGLHQAASQPSSNAVPAIPFAKDHCVSCVDIPILVGAPDHNCPPDWLTLLMPPPLGEGASFDTSLSAGAAPQTAVPVIPLAGSFILTSLRSVILLI